MSNDRSGGPATGGSVLDRAAPAASAPAAGEIPAPAAIPAVPASAPAGAIPTQ